MSERYDLIIHGAIAATPNGIGRADIAIRDGRFAAVGEIEGDAAVKIDARGLHALPGVIRSSLQLEFVAPSRLRNHALSLDILDLTGRSVRRWSVDPASSTGLRADWDLRADDGHPVPAGVYFLHAQLGPQLLTRRVIVLR